MNDNAYKLRLYISGPGFEGKTAGREARFRADTFDEFAAELRWRMPEITEELIGLTVKQVANREEERPE